MRNELLYKLFKEHEAEFGELGIYEYSDIEKSIFVAILALLRRIKKLEMDRWT
jgi:hypothetical protein